MGWKSCKDLSILFRLFQVGGWVTCYKPPVVWFGGCRHPNNPFHPSGFWGFQGFFFFLIWSWEANGFVGTRRGVKVGNIVSPIPPKKGPRWLRYPMVQYQSQLQHLSRIEDPRSPGDSKAFKFCRRCKPPWPSQRSATGAPKWSS